MPVVYQHRSNYPGGKQHTHTHTHAHTLSSITTSTTTSHQCQGALAEQNFLFLTDTAEVSWLSVDCGTAVEGMVTRCSNTVSRLMAEDKQTSHHVDERRHRDGEVRSTIKVWALSVCVPCVCYLPIMDNESAPPTKGSQLDLTAPVCTTFVNPMLN